MIIKIFFLITLVLIKFNSHANENKILIKVDNNIITSYDILTEINYLSEINKNFENLSSEQSIEIAKNSLIKEKIKEIELYKFIDEIKIEENQLNKILINNFNNLGFSSIEDFNKYFLLKKINPKIIRKKASIEILWNQLIYSKFNDKVKINKKLIEQQVKQNNKKKEYLLSEILFDLDNGEKFTDKLSNIENEINEKSFSEAALKFSISDTSKRGGKLGWVKDTVLSKDIKAKLKNTNVGNYTVPITLPGGFLILKIENIKLIEENLNSEEEIKLIVLKKSQQQLNQFSNIYFNKVKKDIQINEL